MKSLKKKACKVVSVALSIMMTATAFTGFSTTNVSAATVTDNSGNFVYTDLDNGTIQITKCIANGDVDIPSVIDNKKVTSIGEYAFTDGVTSVSIPESVVTIQNYAFYNCYSLEDIEFSEGLKYIGEEAFYNCNIGELNFPETLEEIDDGAFSGNYSVYELNFPKSHGVKIGNNALMSGSWYWSQPDGPIISGKTFIRYKSYGSYIEEYTIPDGIETIGSNAFSDLYSATKIDIPDTVKYISEGAFAYTNITEISIPDGVEFIGDRAFQSCYNLETINLPDSLTYIGAEAFQYCENLTGTIAISDKVTSIGDYAFAYTDVNELDITDNNSITYFGRDVLTDTNWYDSQTDGAIYISNIFVGLKEDTSTLTSINIQDGTKVIASYALYCFDGNINIPDSVEYISDYSLAYTNVTSNNFPNCVKEIGNYSFYSCDNITYLDIPSTLTKIGDCAFYECENLTSMSDTKNITSIGEEAFCNTPIVTFKIGSKLKEIGKNTFYNNPALKEFIVDSNNPYYSSKDGILYNKDKTIIICYPPAKETSTLVITSDILDFKDAFAYSNPYITEIVIKEGVLTIPDNAFTGLYKVETITIPTTVKKIGENIFCTDSALHTVNLNAVDYTATRAFESCENLATVNFGEGVTKISDAMFMYCYNLTDVNTNGNIEFIGDDAFYSTAWDETIRGSQTEGVIYVDKVAYSSVNLEGDVIVKDGTCSIYSAAFEYQDAMTSLTLPDSVKYIGEKAFYHCYDITNITMSSNIESIDNYAFSACISLNSINLGDKLTYIGNHAFSSCFSLDSISLGNNLTYMGEYTFNDCSSLKSITIPSGIEKINPHTFSYCNSLKNVTFNEGLKSIEDSAFSYSSSLENIKLPSTVKKIGYDAFYYSGIKNIELNEGLETIANYAFEYCENLESITCPTTLKTIDYYAFYSCNSLKNVTLNEGLEQLGDSVFEYCYALESIEIPSTVTEISYSSFYGCPNLKSVTLNEGLKAIYYNAFSNCPNLTEIFIPSTVSEIDWDTFDKDMTIHGYTNSYAQYYVDYHWYDEDLNHTFVAIERTMGDVNGDGIVTITDATELQKYIADMSEFTDKQLACADVDYNGNIDIKDVSYIAKALAGIVEL